VSRILGYGEDALTFWALRQRLSDILSVFDDKTSNSDCLILYRPSFGRQSKENGSVFGEFDAIIASQENVYLVESKWDKLSGFKEYKFALRKEQALRHRVLSWYLSRWSRKYLGKWASFVKQQQHDFKFNHKTIAPPQSLLAQNLEFALNRILEHCKAFSSEENVKNVVLFFYRKGKSEPSSKIEKAFTFIPIDYSKVLQNNYVAL
jgi:hypothetical protein